MRTAPATGSPRRVTIEEQARFRATLARPSAAEIDALLDEMTQTDPANFNPPSRRKDAELARVLFLLDNLPSGKDSDDRF